MIEVKFELEKGAHYPLKAHQHDAGWDLYALDPQPEYDPKDLIVETGVHLLIPAGYVGLVLPRSSISARGIHVATGVIDAGYTGTIKVTAWDHRGHRPKRINAGTKIAQIVFMKLTDVYLQADNVQRVKTPRGSQGFGSTGGIL